MGRTLFAIFHMALLLGLLAYGLVLLFRGETSRGFTTLAILGLYYAIVIHKAVLAEIERKRRLKKKSDSS